MFGTLCEAARVAHDARLTSRARLQRIVELVPQGWPDPEFVEARLIVRGDVYETAGFTRTRWCAETRVDARSAGGGLLEVVLTRAPIPTDPVCPPEQRAFLDAVARLLAGAVEREHLRTLITRTATNVGEAVLIFRTEGEAWRIVDANPAAAAMFGVAPADLVGRTTEAIHASQGDHTALREASLTALEARQTFRASGPMRRADGSVFPAEFTLSLLHPEVGMDGGLVSVVRDVSERVRAETELRRSEERLSLIADHVGQVFWVMCPESGSIEYVSAAYEEIWGRPRSDLYADPALWIDTIDPRDRDRVVDTCSFENTNELEREFRIVRPDGQVRWIRERVTYGQSPGDGAPKMVGVAEDVTERKRTAERLALLGREMADIIHVLDESFRVRFVTPSMTHILGYDPGSMVGVDAVSMIHEDDRKRFRAGLETLLGEPGATLRSEYRALHADGTWRHMESVARNLVQHPGIEGIVVTSRDVTERVRMQQIMDQRQRLESVGSLAGGVAHDFNNILTVIRGQAELLIADGGLTPEQTDDIRLIEESADRAAVLTRQLLAFSREQVLQPRIVDLPTLLDGVQTLLGRTLGDHIRLERRADPDVPPVNVDPAQLEQVVVNLAINARDAMPRGGTLTMALTTETLGEGDPDDPPPGDYAVLRVSDTGCGIPQSLLTRIFEPFFTTKPKEKGTGLGLAMAYGVVRQSGGSLTVKSEVGSGSTFTIHLPVVPAPEAEEVDSGRERRARDRDPVLVGRDEPGAGG